MWTSDTLIVALHRAGCKRYASRMDWEVIHEAFMALMIEERRTTRPQAELLRAHCSYEDGNEYGTWMLAGEASESVRERFNLRATQAGKLLDTPLVESPRNYFLHNLYRYLRDAGSDHLFAATDKGGIIKRVVEASATYCVVLQRRAVERSGLSQLDYNYLRIKEALEEPTTTPLERVAKPDNASPSVPPPQIFESIGEQIDRLRDESNLSIEELAFRVKIDPRTVQRHLADDSIPYGRNLRAYERAFSNILERKVVIRKMP